MATITWNASSVMRPGSVRFRHDKRELADLRQAGSDNSAHSHPSQVRPSVLSLRTAAQFECPPPPAHTAAMVRRRGDQRGLTTVLFTDICRSTRIAAELGDRRWRYLLIQHHAAVRKELRRYGGREIDTAGDGFFASFASPAAAVRCAFAIVTGMREIGLDIRAGLHIGEAELSGEKTSGIAVTTGKRVEEAAGPAQVLATDTIVHLVAGSGFDFTDVGSRELKGVPGSWELFGLDAVDGESIGPPLDPRQATEFRQQASPVRTSASPSRLGVLGLVGIAVLVAGGVLFAWKGHNGSPAQASPTPGTARPIEVLDETTGEVAFPVAIEGGWGSNIILTPSAKGPAIFAWLRSGGCAHSSGCPGKLRKIDGGSGAVVYTFPYTLDPLAMVQTEGSIWILASRGGHGVFVEEIDESTNRTSHHMNVIKDIGTLGDVVRLTAGGHSLWIADTINRRVIRLDLLTDKLHPHEIEGSVDDIAFGGGYLWVMDSVAATVTRINPEGGKPETRSLNQLDTLSSITFGGGYVWATDNSANEVWRVSTDLDSTTSVGVGMAPDDVVYANGAIWVANYGDETVSKINPGVPAETQTYPVNIHPRALGVADGKIWVAGDVYTSDIT